MFRVTFRTLQVIFQEFEFGEKVELPEAPPTRLTCHAQAKLDQRDVLQTYRTMLQHFQAT